MRVQLLSVLQLNGDPTQPASYWFISNSLSDEVNGFNYSVNLQSKVLLKCIKAWSGVMKKEPNHEQHLIAVFKE